MWAATASIATTHWPFAADAATAAVGDDRGWCRCDDGGVAVMTEDGAAVLADKREGPGDREESSPQADGGAEGGDGTHVLHLPRGVPLPANEGEPHAVTV